MITTLTMENFLPFRQRVVLPLANQGLVLLRGRNLVSAAASDNGTGKTSVVHALSYGLFGVDLLGRRADAVACRFTEGQAIVHIEMEDDLGSWSVNRTRRPASLLTTGIPGVLENEDMAVLQTKLEQRLGFGLQTFRNAIVFGQGAFDRYSGADQNEQLRMLDEIQGVDFSDALKAATDWRRDLQRQRDEALKLHGATEAEVVALAGTIGAQEAARASFEGDRTAKVIVLKGRRKVLVERRDQLTIELAAIKHDAERYPGLQAQLEAFEGLQKTYATQKDSLAFDQQALTKADKAVGDLRARRDHIAALPECPTCLRPATDNLNAVRDAYSRLIDPLVTAAEEAGCVVAAAWTTVKAAETAQTDAWNALNLATAERQPGLSPWQFITYLNGRSRSLVPSASLVTDIKAQLSDLDTTIAETREAVWGGAAALAQAQATHAVAQAKVQTLTTKLAKLAEAIAAADYCVEAGGDRGIRSMLVDGVADFMNERIASHLETLAAGEAKCIMSATTPTKKGTSRERISFATTWDWGAAGTDGSGGQDRRKDLAVFAAAQDLAESRSARPFPIRIFDEPFDALDAKGKELACEWVRKIAKAQGTALLITHSEEISAMVEADRVWTVVMTREGAHVEIT